MTIKSIEKPHAEASKNTKIEWTFYLNFSIFIAIVAAFIVFAAALCLLLLLLLFGVPEPLLVDVFIFDKFFQFWQLQIVRRKNN